MIQLFYNYNSGLYRCIHFCSWGGDIYLIVGIMNSTSENLVWSVSDMMTRHIPSSPSSVSSDRLFRTFRQSSSVRLAKYENVRGFGVERHGFDDGTSLPIPLQSLQSAWSVRGPLSASLTIRTSVCPEFNDINTPPLLGSELARKFL